jgi:hypothetical protein
MPFSREIKKTIHYDASPVQLDVARKHRITTRIESATIWADVWSTDRMKCLVDLMEGILQLHNDVMPPNMMTNIDLGAIKNE